MAVTNQKSTEYTNQSATPPTVMDTTQLHGVVRFAKVTFTQDGAGDATSTVGLVELPAGRVRLIGDMSYLRISAFGASRTLDIGWAAYTDIDGAAVVADADGLDDGLDVSAASAINLGSATATTDGDTYKFESQSGVVINATVLGGTIPDAATIKGYIAYVMD